MPQDCLVYFFLSLLFSQETKTVHKILQGEFIIGLADKDCSQTHGPNLESGNI